MNDEKKEALDNFLMNLMDANSKEFANTEEVKHRIQRERYLRELLDTDLTNYQKQLVDEVLDQFNGFSAREMTILYQQAFLDCVFLLKELKVIA